MKNKFKRYHHDDVVKQVNNTQAFIETIYSDSLGFINVFIEPIKGFGSFYLHLDREIEGKRKIGLSLQGGQYENKSTIASIHNFFKPKLKNMVFSQLNPIN